MSDTDSLSIRRVRNNRKSIYIEWDSAKDAIKRTFHANPRKSFYKALDNLIPFVCELCEFPAKDSEKITVTGITVSGEGDDIKGMIIARKKIAKGKRVLNIPTPILRLYQSKEEGDESDHMTAKQAAGIEKVLLEAEKYLNGDREQGEIKYEEEEGEPEKDESGQTELSEVSS